MATNRVTVGRYPRDFDAPCETGRLRARKRLTPWLEICHRVGAHFPSTSVCLRAPWSFCLRKASCSCRWSRRQQCSGRQPCGSRKGCGTCCVRALRLLHRAAQSGKQRRTWAAPRRDVAYRLYRVDVCWCRPGALVSNGRALSRLFHSTNLSPLLSTLGDNFFFGFESTQLARRVQPKRTQMEVQS